jgi:hypothetical protein
MEREDPIDYEYIKERDRIFEADNKHIALFGTPTPSSFLRVVEEACGNYMSPDTCFIDLGSGLGHTLFYMHKKYPFVHCIGIELEKDFHKEAIERRKHFELNDDQIKLVNGNLFKYNGYELDRLTQCKNLVVFSFDVLFPTNLLAHIKNDIIDKTKKPLVWINSVKLKDTSQKLLHNRCYIGPPGVNENDARVVFKRWIQPEASEEATVRELNLDYDEEEAYRGFGGRGMKKVVKPQDVFLESLKAVEMINPEDDQSDNRLVKLRDYFDDEKYNKIIQDKRIMGKFKKINDEWYGEFWRVMIIGGEKRHEPAVIEINEFLMYVYKKENLMIDCMVCGKRRANYVCSCCFVQKYCGESCQKKDWPH